jgi:ribosome biogenesis GTPase / thiamine phosphate phosphatase
MPIGQIVKAISGFYYVRTPEDELIRCRARGIFKFERKKITLLVGDFVQFKKIGPNNGFITSIQLRQTELIRPSIANVNQAVVVSSLREPNFQQGLVDRFLVHGEHKGLDLVICLTKYDLVDNKQEIEEIRAIYQPTGYPVILTSIYNQVGIEELKNVLHQKVSVFAGQSGVGKSSLLRSLIPNYPFKTGEVSAKLGRGRHTTRLIELISLNDGGQVADTPGFNRLSFQGFEPQSLSSYFPEIKIVASRCYYRGCLHVDEPQCEVQHAVLRKEIHEARFQHYLQFLGEIQEEKKRRY